MFSVSSFHQDIPEYLLFVFCFKSVVASLQEGVSVRSSFRPTVPSDGRPTQIFQKWTKFEPNSTRIMKLCHLKTNMLADSQDASDAWTQTCSQDVTICLRPKYLTFHLKTFLIIIDLHHACPFLNKLSENTKEYVQKHRSIEIEVKLGLPGAPWVTDFT